MSEMDEFMSDAKAEMEDFFGKAAERKRIDAIFWGGALLWAGVVFAADSLGLLPQVGEAGPWSWIFFGAGLYALLFDFYRVASATYSSPRGWEYIFAGVLMIIGLAGLTSINILWPAFLILIGAILLGNTLLRRE